MSIGVRMAALIWALHAGIGLLSGQLIAPGQPVPHTANPPVVFLNGYQNGCGGGSSFSGTFGIADQVLQAAGEVSLFFDNCAVPGTPSIEKLGTAFGEFLAALRYEDGKSVDAVDVVVHSMGGLIVRSYLSGKQEKYGVFTPPEATHIRKAIFIATPHFGSELAALGIGSSLQLDELASGSQFLFGVATWNNGGDDLRGIDAVAVIGNGGSGRVTTPGFDDGLVTLTSASLGFYQPGRTRVVPFCHTDGGGLITTAGLCDANAKGIAIVRSAGDDTARVMVSFLNGTTDWQTVGKAAEENSFLSTLSGLNVQERTASDVPQKLGSATAEALGGTAQNLVISNDGIAHIDSFPAGKTVLAGNGNLTRTVSLAAGAGQVVTLKLGPNVARAQPSAAALFPLSLAPRTIISIYGNQLAASTGQAQSIPLPKTLGDTTVTAGGSPIGLLYVSPGQINAVLPDDVAGLVKLAVQNPAGVGSVNLLVEAAHPAIFTINQSGSGAAAAINARNASPVAANNPLRADDYLELYLTGLGATARENGVDSAVVRPTVEIDGAVCRVTFAGAAPGFVGLDQINCQVPSGLAANPAAPVTVKSGGRTSNAVTVAVE